LRVVRFVITVANDPVRRFGFLWRSVAWAIAIIFLIIGAGYLVGGQSATTDAKTLQLLSNVEGGNYRVHGAIMMAVGIFLVYSIGSSYYTRYARYALQLVSFYSLFVAAMIFGGWYLYDIEFGSPWWYLFTAFLSAVLLILSPPIVHGRRRAGGGGSA
jgi:hypothetical protein